MAGFKPNEVAHRNLEDMIVVCGVPRSGTTILGKLVGTFSGIEYAFEPTLLPYLDAAIQHDSIDEDLAVELLTAYLHSDYFANYLQGRYNFRPDDASNILSMKTAPEVLEKWTNVNGTVDALSRTPLPTFAFKSPSIYPTVDLIVEGFPSARVLDLHRNLERVVASLMDKRWFADDQLDESSVSNWPFRDVDADILIPYHVREEDIDRWQSMTPASRTVYFCNRVVEKKLAFKEEHGGSDLYREVNYERFVGHTSEVADNLATFLDCEYGKKTEAVIGEVAFTDCPYDVNEIMNRCADDIKEDFFEYRDVMEG